MAEIDPPAQQSSQHSEDTAVAALRQDPDWIVSELARRRGGGLALAVATLVALLGFGAGWLAVKDDIAAYHSVGLTLLGLYRFPLFVALISAALTYGVVSRLANGPSLSRSSYELFFPTGSQPWPRFAELRADLAKLGYRLSAHQPNLAQDQPMSDEATLDQGTWWIREATSPSRRAGVVLRLTPELGQGSVAIADTSGGLYGELAKFLIVALGRKVPELTFKETSSHLSAESWEWLPPQLPDTPRALPASRA
jgi:hypothetical protein